MPSASRYHSLSLSVILYAILRTRERRRQTIVTDGCLPFPHRGLSDTLLGERRLDDTADGADRRPKQAADQNHPAEMNVGHLVVLEQFEQIDVGEEQIRESEVNAAESEADNQTCCGPLQHRMNIEFHLAPRVLLTNSLQARRERTCRSRSVLT